MNISNPLVRKREIEGLLDAMSMYNLKEGMLLTLEEEMNIEQLDKNIQYIPLWKWLLQKKT